MSARTKILTRRATAVLGAAAAAATLTALPANAATATKTVSPAVEVCGEGAAVTHPTSMILTCADNGEMAKNLKWTSWSATSATATGQVSWRSGAANLAHATTWKSTSAQFTLTDPIAEPGQGTLFTKLVLHVTGSTPRGFMRDLTFDEAPIPAVSAPPAPKLKPSGLSAAVMQPAAASGTLGYAQIEGYWIAAGGPSSEAETAAAITGAESSFEPGIIQQGVDYCGSGSDRAGWGLWQITCGNSVPDFGTDFQLLDPWNNAEAAVNKYNGDEAAGVNGFDPWSTYTSGAYETYMQSTSPATGLTDPGQYTQAGNTPSGTPASPAADPGSTDGPGMPGVAPVQDLAAFYTGNGSLYSMADESGELFEVIQNLTTGTWLNNDTGIKVSGGLTSWYDSSNNSTYSMVDEGGTLYEVIQNMTSGAWSNTSPGIKVSGQLSAFYTGNGSLYTVADESGELFEVIQNLTTGTWLNNDTGIKVSGGLSAWYDSAKTSTYIMADEGGTLYEVIQNMTSGAWSNTSPGISVSGELSTFVTGNGSLYTVADEGGTLYEVIQNLTTGTWLNNPTAISITGGLSAWYDSAKTSTYIMADEGGTLYEVIQNMTSGAWSNTSPGIKG